ncbi:MAG: histidine triad nucleotide-binding protein [Nitrospiraceae bacterium]|nr:histidine triad nucleotide-binding protein [Nitrospiraceae bacterium]
MSDCLFCRIISKEIPAKIVYEDDLCIAFEDINPQAPMHVLVIPRKHIARITDIEADDKELVGHIFTVCGSIAASRGFSGSGFRVVANCNADAGQTVFHIHFHLLGGRLMGWPPG